MSADRPPVAAQRYEVIGQAGPAVDLDQQLGQIDLGHAGSTSFVQPRFLGRLGGIDDELGHRPAAPQGSRLVHGRAAE